MNAIRTRLLVLFACLFGAAFAVPVAAQTPSTRIALVIGNGAYPAGADATAPNDAGLVAQTLTAAGFDVTGARDLDSDAIRGAFRDFLTKAGQLGPDGIVFVYLSGYGLQFEGDNYYVPVEATLTRESDISIQAIRVSDLTRALSGLQLKARVTVLDTAYKTPFPAAANLAGGMALVEPEPGSLLAFNAAPGTLGPQTAEAYGVYGQAVAEMLRQGGIPVQEVFDRIRLRVNAQTQGADVPWDASRLTQSFVFLERAPDAPAPATPPATYATLERRPIREFPVAEAYNAAVARDTFEGYQEFCQAFPDSPYVRRVRALLAARREALTWRKTVSAGTSAAYWSYLRRYSRGPHAADARRRLQAMSVALLPPPDFEPIDYDIPPPPPDELTIVAEPVVVFDEPDYGPPPPPPPVYFLPPPQETIYDLPPPPPPPSAGILPVPIPIPIPYARSLGQPGRLDPVQGVRGSYAQPQPFVQSTSGGLTAQPAPDQGGALQPLSPAPQGTPVGGRPRPAGSPSGNLPGAQRPGVPLPGQAAPGTPVGGAPAAGAPGAPQAPVVQPGRPGLVVPNTAAPATPARPGAAPLPGQAVPGTPGGRVPLPGTPGAPQAPVVQPGHPGLVVPNTAAPGSSARPGAAPLPGQAVPGTPGARVPLPGTPGAPQLPQAGQGGRPAPGAPISAPGATTPHQLPNPAGPPVGAQRPAVNTPLPGQTPPGAPIPNGRVPVPGTPVRPNPAVPSGSARQPAPAPLPNQQDQVRPPEQQRQQQDQVRQQQLQQQRQQQDQVRQQQLQQQRQQQDQVRQQQLQQQRQQQDQVRQQQLQQQRQQQDQVRQQQLQQQRQQQEQVRQQQMQQQRQQQDQVRQQQLQQQRQQQEQVRQQQMQQQRQQQDQVRQQQLQQQRQQQDQVRQQQMQQQRQQQEQVRQQQMQQMRQQQARPPEPQRGPPGRPECGHPGQPPCR